jgi:hypothetical protein
MITSFNNFKPDYCNDGEPASLDYSIEKPYTWNECLACCDVMKQFLEQKDMTSELLAA